MKIGLCVSIELSGRPSLELTEEALKGLSLAKQDRELARLDLGKPIQRRFWREKHTLWCAMLLFES